MAFMDAVLLSWPVVLTPWKVIGYAGAGCFGLRWAIQAWHRKQTGSREIPTVFWVISLIGAGATLCYFIWGKNDSVGILSNALPMSVAAYNLFLDLRHRRTPVIKPVEKPDV